VDVQNFPDKVTADGGYMYLTCMREGEIGESEIRDTCSGRWSVTISMFWAGTLSGSHLPYRGRELQKNMQVRVKSAWSTRFGTCTRTYKHVRKAMPKSTELRE